MTAPLLFRGAVLLRQRLGTWQLSKVAKKVVAPFFLPLYALYKRGSLGLRWRRPYLLMGKL